MDKFKASKVSEKRRHALVRWFCTGKLDVSHGPIYSIHTPRITECLIPKDSYDKLITLPGILFNKLIRMISVGLFKYLSKQPADFLNGLDLKGESFHQLILADQRECTIDPKTYKKSTVTCIRGAWVVTLHRKYDHELPKVLPLIEDRTLSNC